MSVLLKRKRGRPRLNESKFIKDFDSNLVEWVKKFPICYDKEHPHYRNRDHTERTYRHIASNLNVSANLVRNRIFQLRNRYNVEKRREVVHPGIKSHWPLFKDMEYLVEYRRTQRTTTQNPGLSSRDGEEIDVDEEDMIEKDADDGSGYIMQDTIDVSQQPEFTANHHPPKIQHIPKPTTPEVNDLYNNKFKKFGEFLAYSLIEISELDETQALHLIKKFTTELVEYSNLNERKQLPRSTIVPHSTDEEENVLN